MCDWKEICLKEIFNVKHGFAFKGQFFTDKKTSTILVTPGNFAIGGGFQNPKPKYYKGEIPKEYILKPGQVIVTMTDLSKEADTLGYAAIVPDDDNVWLHNQRIGLLEFKETFPSDPVFINYLLRSNKYRSWIIGSASGTTVKHTSPNRILAFKCKIPPLPEQRAIAHILGSLDDKIELNRRMNETLEAIARTLFKSWFVDFDPVVYNAVQAGNPVPERFSQAAARYRNGAPCPVPDELTAFFPDSFEDSELGEIPKGWGVKSLDQIANYLNGLACQKYPPKKGEESLPVIKIRELRQGITENTDLATPNVPVCYIVRDGDVLFSWSGSLLIDIWTQGKGVLNQHLFNVTSDTYPKWFYYYWTEFHLIEFQRVAAYKATTMGHIKRQNLTDAKCFIANDGLMKIADAQIAPLLTLRINNELEIRRLTSLRDTLLPILISGELRVPDAEKFVEEAGV